MITILSEVVLKRVEYLFYKMYGPLEHEEMPLWMPNTEHTHFPIFHVKDYRHMYKMGKTGHLALKLNLEI